MYDIIVFEILRIHKSTRRRKAGVFKNLNAGELFWKDAFSVTVFTGYEWTVGQTGEEGPEPINCSPFLSPVQSSLPKPGFH